MPIRTLPADALVDPLDKPLQQLIADEMRAATPTPDGPLVMLRDAGGPYGYKHLFVVWDEPEWADLDRLRRSEIALDAYEDAEGVDEALKITQCWGVTSDEAGQFGIRVPVG